MDDLTTSELAMHLYRKFHARGGVRRVYATADKNWDRQGWARWLVTGMVDDGIRGTT